jgi:hypothetical protein
MMRSLNSSFSFHFCWVSKLSQGGEAHEAGGLIEVAYEPSDATISRVRMRDLARRGRFRPDLGRFAASPPGVRFATGERPAHAPEQAISSHQSS